ncbi:coagulation factor X [Exaiptasia diaphana]|uniref:Uncharacterized protein n=1 Tax=Exaiptasia diaphana TaxID=2652724 RepID=A0A913X1Z3_EXADI|nr:coagulation factor X [Exaiptasia diaphana]
MKNFIAALLLLSFAIVALTFKPDSDDIRLSSNQANHFMKRLKIAKRDLYHECYVEEYCTWEEVKEVKGGGEDGKEYFNSYKSGK